jgi:hypothetical protein
MGSNCSVALGTGMVGGTAAFLKGSDRAGQP